MKDTNYTPKTVFRKLLICGLIFAVIHTVLERSLSTVMSDVALDWLARPLDIGIILCDVFYFFVLYGFSLFSAHCFGPRASLASLLLLFALSLVMHIGNWATFLISENITQAHDLRLSYIAMLSSILIAVVQHALVILGLCITLSRNRAERNPKIAAAVTAAIMVFLNLLSLLIRDIDAGLPDSTAETLVIIAAYLFDILLYGLAGYAIIRMIFRKETKEYLNRNKE